VRVLTGRERGWYARNNNLMAEHARGRRLLLINNDTVVLDGWFEPLWRLAEEDRRAAVIGGLQTFEDGCTINHAGVVFNDRRLPRHLYEGLPADIPPAGLTREMQAVTGACWLADAETFRALGGLHEGFRNGYEDIDYCLRARTAGHRVLYCGESRIIHYGGSSAARHEQEFTNRALFLDRCGEQVEPDLDDVMQRDAMHWPPAPALVRAARNIWHWRLTRLVVHPILRRRTGMRLRQWVVHRLATAGRR
jgi:O-antigen biosynthesis protein